jgi:hypothetical protein
MSSHTADVLVLLGTIALTIAAAGQAALDLTEFMQETKTAGGELAGAARQGGRTTGALIKRPTTAVLLASVPVASVVFLITTAFFLWRGIAKLHGLNAHYAVRVVRLLLKGLLWSVIMAGSGLTLWAAAIQV